MGGIFGAIVNAAGRARANPLRPGAKGAIHNTEPDRVLRVTSA
jgi:hypothetical protein